jgi:hypothetical protein
MLRWGNDIIALTPGAERGIGRRLPAALTMKMRGDNVAPNLAEAQ